MANRYAAAGEGSVYRARALCYMLLSELIDCFRAERSPEKGGHADYQYERIARIVSYLNEHYAENLTLQTIAEREFLSVPYLSKFFQRMMGVGFSSYLNQLRLSNAVSELGASGDTIEAIAERNGFPNTQSFVQQFKKKYGVLPSQWRKQRLDLRRTGGPTGSFNDYAILDNHEYLNYFADYLRESAAEAISPAPVLPDVVSRYAVNAARDGTRLRSTWKRFTAVGSARELLQADVQRMLAELQKNVGFTYIKFHGILSDNMHVAARDRNGNLSYSFIYVDRVLDFLLSVGLKPLIQLSFMPEVLAAEPQCRIFDSTMINSPPASMEAWCDLARALLEHLMLRYGAKETESWLYTVWNEPDTPQNMFGFPDDETFYAFYRATREVIRAVNPRLRIGSPSTYFDPGDGGTWMRRFSEWCIANGCLPDFVIFHYYGTLISYEEVEAAADISLGQIQLTTDENMLAKSIEMIRAYTSEVYSPETPVYLTEWNFSPSHRELLGDTCFRSCYLVKNILENYDRLDGMGYWLLTDLFEEHQVPGETFHGGLGLYTYNGIRKPAWYAYWLLAKLGDELVDRGDGYFLTRRDDEYQLMLYHYKHFSALYAACETFDVTETNRYTPFGAEQRRDFEICIEGLPEGSWRAREYSLSRQSGSAFDKWVEMGAQPIESAEEVELLQSLSRPMMNKYTLQAGPGGLTVNAILEPLEVKLILLEQ